jgi:hypothetical protein
LQIGWQRADNIDAGDLHQLADGLYADLGFAAVDNFANSRRALAGGWRNEADLRDPASGGTSGIFLAQALEKLGIAAELKST